MPSLLTKYAGSDWLKIKGYGENISPLGILVADLLGHVYRGIYHVADFAPHALEKTNWTHKHVIELAMPNISIATIDGNSLTEIVVLAHDLKLRVALKPRNFQYITLVFSERNGPEDSLMEGCPSMEDHIKHIRKFYEVKETEN